MNLSLYKLQKIHTGNCSDTLMNIKEIKFKSNFKVLQHSVLIDKILNNFHLHSCTQCSI